jgi:hypothetical protein
MNKRVVVAVFGVVATLALSTSLVYAGGGMGTGAGVTTCRLVMGSPKQYQIISQTDDFTPPAPPGLPKGDVMSVGTLSLLCDLPATNGFTTNPAPNTGGTGNPVLPTEQNSMSCYSVGPSFTEDGKIDKTQASLTVEDTFTRTFNPNGTYSVTLSAINLVCVPARYHVNTP